MIVYCTFIHCVVCVHVPVKLQQVEISFCLSKCIWQLNSLECKSTGDKGRKSISQPQELQWGEWEPRHYRVKRASISHRSAELNGRRKGIDSPLAQRTVHNYDWFNRSRVRLSAFTSLNQKTIPVHPPLWNREYFLLIVHLSILRVYVLLYQVRVPWTFHWSVV